METVKGKVVLVTGGAGVLGFAMSVKLLEEGAKGISIVDLSEEAGLKTVDEITEKFGKSKAIFVKADITVEKDFEDAFETTVKTFNQLDIVINNAGIANEVDWKKTIFINLVAAIEGTYLAMQKYLPKYRSEDEGVVVNISSVAGLSPVQFAPMYCMTKGGLIHLGRCLGG